jgi:hypothetical protein
MFELLKNFLALFGFLTLFCLIGSHFFNDDRIPTMEE